MLPPPHFLQNKLNNGVFFIVTYIYNFCQLFNDQLNSYLWGNICIPHITCFCNIYKYKPDMLEIFIEKK